MKYAIFCCLHIKHRAEKKKKMAFIIMAKNKRKVYCGALCEAGKDSGGKSMICHHSMKSTIQLVKLIFTVCPSTVEII